MVMFLSLFHVIPALAVTVPKSSVKAPSVSEQDQNTFLKCRFRLRLMLQLSPHESQCTIPKETYGFFFSNYGSRTLFSYRKITQ